MSYTCHLRELPAQDHLGSGRLTGTGFSLVGLVGQFVPFFFFFVPEPVDSKLFSKQSGNLTP